MNEKDIDLLLKEAFLKSMFESIEKFKYCGLSIKFDDDFKNEATKEIIKKHSKKIPEIDVRIKEDEKDE